MTDHQSFPSNASAFDLPAFKPWREIAILSIIVMEMCWVVPWFRSMTPATYTTNPGKAFLIFIGIELSLHWITRLMNFLQLKLSIRRVVLIAGILISMLIGFRALLYNTGSTSLLDLINRPINSFNQIGNLIPDEFIVTLFVFIVSWRGIRTAQDYIEPRTVKRYFLIGIFLFVAFVFFNTIITGETPGIFLYIFFFAGLIALSTARISVITTMRGGILSQFDRRWFLGMFMATLVVVGLAGLVSWLFSERVRLIEQIGSVVLGAFAVVVVGLISPVIFVVESLVPESGTPSNVLGQLLQMLESFRTVLSQVANNLYDFMGRIGFFEWAPRLKSIFLWGVVLFVIFLVVSSLTQWMIKARRIREEEKGSTLSTNEFLQLLKEALQNQLKKLGTNLAGATRLIPGRGWLAAVRIRRIYAELMDLGEKLGKPRPKSHTPLEYLPDLVGIFPNFSQDLSIITSAYLQVRYGEIPETPEALEQVESAWARIRAQGKVVLDQSSSTPNKGTNKGGRGK